MLYETTYTPEELFTHVEEWLLRENLLPSINDIGGLTGEDIAIHNKIEDLINDDCGYWAHSPGKISTLSFAAIIISFFGGSARIARAASWLVATCVAITNPHVYCV